MSEQVESIEKHVETAKVANTSVLVVEVFMSKTIRRELFNILSCTMHMVAIYRAFTEYNLTILI